MESDDNMMKEDSNANKVIEIVDVNGGESPQVDFDDENVKILETVVSPSSQLAASCSPTIDCQVTRYSVGSDEEAFLQDSVCGAQEEVDKVRMAVVKEIRDEQTNLISDVKDSKGRLRTIVDHLDTIREEDNSCEKREKNKSTDSEVKASLSLGKTLETQLNSLTSKEGRVKNKHSVVSGSQPALEQSKKIPCGSIGVGSSGGKPEKVPSGETKVTDRQSTVSTKVTDTQERLSSKVTDCQERLSSKVSDSQERLSSNVTDIQSRLPTKVTDSQERLSQVSSGKDDKTERPSESKSMTDRRSENSSSKVREKHRSSSKSPDRQSEHSSSKAREKHRSSSKSHREHRGDRSGDSHRKTGKKANIGIQCRRDKTLPRTVTSTSTSSDSLLPPPTTIISTPPVCGYSLANPLEPLGQEARPHYRWAHLMYVEVYPNGGGKVLHSWQRDLAKLSELENKEFADEFLAESFCEDDEGFALYCCTIVHNAAKGLPDFLEYLGDEHGDLQVKHGVIGHPRELETVAMQTYRDQVHNHYHNGTFRFGHLDNMSLVGAAAEESGGYLPDILDMLDEIPILAASLPWAERSILHDKVLRHKSNDGPILWIRPGEQSIPTGELGKSPLKNRRRQQAINELQNLKYLPRSSTERETILEDRTPCHADHVGFGLDRMTTAAVGVLKAVRCGENYSYNRICKDTIIFSASSFHYLCEKLKLDLHEPPMSQTLLWLDEAKLNQMYRDGVKFARVPLSDNDIYFLPRNIVHQFRTVSATCSIAWHVRLKEYYEPQPAKDEQTAAAIKVEAVKMEVKMENAGSGSEKENSGELRPSGGQSKKRKRNLSAELGGDTGKVDPDFEPKKNKSTNKGLKKRDESDKDREKRREKERRKDKKLRDHEMGGKDVAKESKEERRERKEKEAAKKSVDNHNKLMTDYHQQHREPKIPYSKVTSADPPIFEKSISEPDSLAQQKKGVTTHPNPELGGERKDKERALLFPHRLSSVDTAKKKLSMSSSSPHKSVSSSPQVKSGDTFLRKPDGGSLGKVSEVKTGENILRKLEGGSLGRMAETGRKSLNFDSPINVNILDQIMSGMSGNTAKKD